MRKIKSFIVHFYEDVSSLFFFRTAPVNKLTKRKKWFSIISPIALAFCLLCYTLLGVLLVTTGCSKTTAISSSPLQEDLAKELLRFHVIANSDSTADQDIKLKVKEELISYLKPYLSDTTSKSEAMDIISEQLDSLVLVANEVLTANGFAYEAEASLSASTFPVKVYGDITLPPGEYDALRIELGKAEGQNWWCIMFPQLCFVDATYSVVPEESKSQLKYLLTDEEYSAIVSDEVDVVVKFKVVEWLKSMFK